MKLDDIQKRLQTYKAGTFINVEWDRDVSSSKCKKSGYTVIKSCNGVVRAAINYKNLNAVKQLQAQSADAETSKISWFEHYSKGIVQNKNDNSKKYLQLFTAKNNKIKTTYFVLENSSDKICMFNKTADELYDMGLVTKSELNTSGDLLTFTLNIDNIVSFGGKA